MATIAGILLPVFAVILCGYLSGRFNLLGAGSAQALNRFVYYFALPPLLFTLTSEARLAEILQWQFIFAFVAGIALTLLVALAGGYLIFGHRSLTLGFHGFTAVFGNTAYMGIPLFVAAYGPQGTLPAVVATIASNLLLIGGIVTLAEFSRAAAASPGRALGKTAVIAVARNPLLVASLLGILFSAAGAALPRPAAATCHLLGAAAVPAALFAIGLSLADLPLTSGAGEIGWLIGLKLCVHPAVTWLLVAKVFVVDPLWGQAAVLLSGMPVGALVFVITRQYGAYVERASAAIVVSTLFSAVSLALLMWLLRVQ